MDAVAKDLRRAQPVRKLWRMYVSVHLMQKLERRYETFVFDQVSARAIHLADARRHSLEFLTKVSGLHRAQIDAIVAKEHHWLKVGDENSAAWLVDCPDSDMRRCLTKPWLNGCETTSLFVCGSRVSAKQHQRKAHRCQRKAHRFNVTSFEAS